MDAPEQPSARATDAVGRGELLHDLWYYAMPSRALGRGRTVAKTLFGTPLLFGRTDDGDAFSLIDICPHRGMPFRYGHFDGQEVECCYHGWRFDRTGACTAIPSLVPGQHINLSRIRARRFPCHESHGNLWVFAGVDAGVAPPPPAIPDIGARSPRIVERMYFPCHVDHAVVGLMDPAHGPFVHQAWWWRSRRSVHEKAKEFAPSELGFRMLPHAPSSNSAGYKLLGGKPTTEITFRLPGVRIEHIRVGERAVVGLTAATPIDHRSTELHHVIYWTIPWLSALRPALRPFARAFLRQDRDIMVKQQDGLAHDPSLMLINDADMQARWYFKLKRAWQTSRATGCPFENPVRETTLRWRS